MKKLHLMATAAMLLALAGCRNSNIDFTEAENGTHAQRPFGLKMGMTPKEVKSEGIHLTEMSTGTYQTNQMPLNHEDFTRYVLLFSSKSGLCSIGAYSESVWTMLTGVELKAKFKYYEDVLSEKYGKPTAKIDQVEEPQAWGAPIDWMPSLLVGKRTYTAQWNLDPAQFNHLQKLSITAQASGRDKGGINIQYAFTNESSCLEDIRKDMNKAL